MTTVTPDMIKNLREVTSAGMLDCRKALTENNGDMEAAIDWLRKKGLSSAAKKSGRVAAEGLVAIASAGNKAAVIELNSETDFVSRNEKFQTLASGIAEFALNQNTNDVEELKQARCPKTGASISEQITQAIATIGENMNLRRCAALSVSKGAVATYIHSATAAGMGKIGVLVALESDGDAEKLNGFGKQLAMHIAAANPTYLSKSEVSAKEISREEDAATEVVAKFFDAYVAFETGANKYKEKMTSERAFSEKVLEQKLTELSQTLPNVDDLISDYAKQSVSEDRKEKQNADKTKKLLDVFFQEAAYMLKKMRSYGDDAAIKAKLKQMKIERFYEENVLEEQIFVIDGKSKITAAVEAAAKDVGAPVKIAKFINFRLGEGIEKAQSDFAAEVAAASGVAAA